MGLTQSIFAVLLSEHFLDIINADFSSNEEVDKILDMWEERDMTGRDSDKANGNKDDDDDVKEGVVSGEHRNALLEAKVMFRRHGLIIARDPLLYVGRAVVFLILNVVFGFVYWKARYAHQDQALNKHFLNLWYCGIATNSKFDAVTTLMYSFLVIYLFS